MGVRERGAEVCGAPGAQGRGGVEGAFRFSVSVRMVHGRRIREAVPAIARACNPGGPCEKLAAPAAPTAATGPVGWVERSETHRPARNHAARNDGFRFALPILHALSSPEIGRASCRERVCQYV